MSSSAVGVYAPDKDCYGREKDIAADTKWYPMGAESIGEVVKRALSDRIASALLKDSSLTQVQLETLLIQWAGNQLAGERRVEELRRFRVKHPVTRGAFNRTLSQALVNVRKSVFTLLLLGYLGLLDDVRLQPFEELGSRLRGYVWGVGAAASQGVIERILADVAELAGRLHRKRDL